MHSTEIALVASVLVVSELLFEPNAIALALLIGRVHQHYPIAQSLVQTTDIDSVLDIVLGAFSPVPDLTN